MGRVAWIPPPVNRAIRAALRCLLLTVHRPHEERCARLSTVHGCHNSRSSALTSLLRTVPGRHAPVRARRACALLSRQSKSADTCGSGSDSARTPKRTATIRATTLAYVTTTIALPSFKPRVCVFWRHPHACSQVETWGSKHGDTGVSTVHQFTPVQRTRKT